MKQKEEREVVMDESYLWLKTLHLFGVTLFLGNIIVTAWWKLMADRTRNPQIIAFAQRQVALTDYVFTAGGAVILLAAGWGNAALHGMDVMHIRWLSWGLWLFGATGLIWVANSDSDPDSPIAHGSTICGERQYSAGVLATEQAMGHLGFHCDFVAPG